MYNQVGAVLDRAYKNNRTNLDPGMGNQDQHVTERGFFIISLHKKIPFIFIGNIKSWVVAHKTDNKLLLSVYFFSSPSTTESHCTSKYFVYGTFSCCVAAQWHFHTHGNYAIHLH